MPYGTCSCAYAPADNRQPAGHRLHAPEHLPSSWWYRFWISLPLSGRASCTGGFTGVSGAGVVLATACSTAEVVGRASCTAGGSRRSGSRRSRIESSGVSGSGFVGSQGRSLPAERVNGHGVLCGVGAIDGFAGDLHVGIRAKSIQHARCCGGVGIVLALIAPDDGIGLALILVLGAIDHIISAGSTLCLFS